MNNEQNIDELYGNNQNGGHQLNFPPPEENKQEKNDHDNEVVVKVINFRRYQKKILIIFLAVVLAVTCSAFAFGYFWGKQGGSAPSKESLNNTFLAQLPQMIKYLKENYYGDLSEKEIEKIIYQSIFKTTNDRYTQITPVQISDSNLGPKKGGFGITVAAYNNAQLKIRGFEVSGIALQSQAFDNIMQDKDTIYPGDIIIGIKEEGKYFPFCDLSNFTQEDEIKNGTQTILNDELQNYLPFLSITPEQARHLIIYSPNRVPQVHTVVLTYKPYPTTTKRFVNYAILNKTTGTTNFLSAPFTFNGKNKTNNVAYLQLLEFADKSEDEVASALLEIDKVLVNQTDELILDLRNNPGGNKGSLDKIIAQFVPRAKEQSERQILYAFIKNAHKKNKATHKATYLYNDQGILTPKPYRIKILVDAHTASAAEVLAVVLKEFCPNTKVYGTKTFGKDVYQVISSGLFKSVEYPYGFNVRITEGKWGYTKTNSPRDIHYITDPGYEINPLTATANTKQLAPNLLTSLYLTTSNQAKYNTVSNDNILLTLVLEAYILENTSAFASDYVQKITNGLLRKDKYFDEDIKVALNMVREKLGLPTNSAALTYDDTKAFIKLNLQNNYTDYHGFVDMNKAITKFLDKMLLECIYEGS